MIRSGGDTQRDMAEYSAAFLSSVPLAQDSIQLPTSVALAMMKKHVAENLKHSLTHCTTGNERTHSTLSCICVNNT